MVTSRACSRIDKSTVLGVGVEYRTTGPLVYDAARSSIVVLYVVFLT